MVALSTSHLTLSLQAGGGDDSGDLVRVRELHHAKHSLLPRFAALVFELSPEHLAVHVRPADSLVEDWRIAQHFAWIQSDLRGNRRRRISSPGHQVVRRI